MKQQCFSSLKNQKKLLLNFYKILQASYENGKVKNCEFVKEFWKRIFKICNKKMVRYWQWNKGWHSHENPIKCLISSIESSLCDYSDAYILLTENIAVTRTIAVANAGSQPQRKKELTAATQVTFKECAPFKKCRGNQWKFCWWCRFY